MWALVEFIGRFYEVMLYVGVSIAVVATWLSVRLYRKFDRDRQPPF